MLNNLVSDDRIPVTVGVGEIVDRPKEISKGLEPLVLLEQALKRAEADSGDKLLGEIQSLDIVNFLSWRYRDPEQQLADRLGPAEGISPPAHVNPSAPEFAGSRAPSGPACGGGAAGPW